MINIIIMGIYELESIPTPVLIQTMYANVPNSITPYQFNYHNTF